MEAGIKLEDRMMLPRSKSVRKDKAANLVPAICGDCQKPIVETDKAVWLGDTRVHATCGEKAWLRGWSNRIREA